MPVEADPATASAPRPPNTKEPWTLGLVCPGCKGIWKTAGLLAQHLPNCRPFDFPTMLLTQRRLSEGESMDAKLIARYREYEALGMGPLGAGMC